MLFKIKQSAGVGHLNIEASEITDVIENSVEQRLRLVIGENKREIGEAKDTILRFLDQQQMQKREIANIKLKNEKQTDLISELGKTVNSQQLKTVESKMAPEKIKGSRNQKLMLNSATSGSQ